MKKLPGKLTLHKETLKRLTGTRKSGGFIVRPTTSVLFCILTLAANCW